jgi:hypothetical protein
MLAELKNTTENYMDTIITYQQKAYDRLGVSSQNFKPELGYLANQHNMNLMYLYYQQMALLEPKFLWMALARLTGGQVLWGMNRLVKIAKDPCILTIHIVQIAKDIFEKMAWQHELYITDYELLIITLAENEKVEQSSFSYKKIWETIKNGNAIEIAEANKELLFNEQNNTVQKHYDIIRQDAYSRKFLWLTRFTMRCIHPYHNRFIIDVPIKDVTEFRYRWHWISHTKGMWNSWKNLNDAERKRLIALPNDKIMNHDWLK